MFESNLAKVILLSFLLVLAACSSIDSAPLESETISEPAQPQPQIEAAIKDATGDEKAKADSRQQTEAETAALTIEESTSPEVVVIDKEDPSAEIVQSVSAETTSLEAEMEKAGAENTITVENATEEQASIKMDEDNKPDRGKVMVDTNRPSEEQQTLLATLPVRNVAPAIANETWLNTEALNWNDLRGKVVIVEFWTYG